MNSGSLARAYLFVLSCYHIFTGLISMFFPDFAMRFYKGIYGCNPIEKRHLSLILKPWGVLSVFAGFAGLLPVFDPERFLVIVLGLIALLLYRMYYRLHFEHLIFSIGGIPPHRNRLSVVVIGIGILILGYYYALGAQ